MNITMSLQYKRYPITYYILVTCLITCVCAAAEPEGYRPPDGFIPNANTAIRVAEAVLSPIFGEEKIQKERPFSAKLEGDIWTVSGHLDKDYFGGVAEIRIAKSDGRVLAVSHGK
jgi:hypothetical protein